MSSNAFSTQLIESPNTPLIPAHIYVTVFCTKADHESTEFMIASDPRAQAA